MMMLVALALGGVVIAMIVGSVWYSPKTPMGKLHMRYLGFDQLSREEQQQKMEKAKPMMPTLYGVQGLLSLLTSFAVVLIITMSVQNGVPFGMALGFVLLNWLCFMVPVVGSDILWGSCEPALAWKKFFSDISAHLVTLLLIALLAGSFVM